MSKQVSVDVIKNEETELCSQTQLSVLCSEFKRDHYELSCWKDSKGNIYGKEDKIAISEDTIISAQWRGELLDVEYDTGYIVDYLCFTAEESGSTIKLNKSSTSAPTITLQYSSDQSNWIDYTWSGTTGSTVTLANVGDKVYFRAGESGNTRLGSSISNYHQFIMTGKIAASGNIMSLLDQTLESKTLTDGCNFKSLFSGCKYLTSAPKLPATTLAADCYRAMFQGCSSMTTSPELPATTLATDCYYYMFGNCSKLNSVQKLTATTLAYGCYRSMFYDCVKLTSAPELPATTLTTDCYYSMFSGCKNLKISENGSSGSTVLDMTKISSIPTNAVTDMFTFTGGTFTGTPTLNNKYLCY